MNVILLISVIFGVSLHGILKAAYNKRTQGGAYIFSAISSLVACLMFLIMGITDFKFQSGMFLYSFLFALSYGVGALFSFLSIKNGSLALTSLFTSYSLIVPTFWGIFFLNEPTGRNLFIGIILLCISIFLVNLKETRKENNIKTKITLKWGVYVFLAFLGNGMCSTVQKLQQIKFNGAGKNEFMAVALSMVFLFFFLMSLKNEKETVKPCIKCGAWFMVFCGLANGLVNLFVMILSNTMPASVMFPLISAGGITLTALVSIFFYKEKLSLFQKLGLLLGIASVVFLNL